MSQKKIYKYLKERPNKWIDGHKISEEVDVSYNSANRSLIKLCKTYDEIECANNFERKQRESMYLYRYKTED